MKRRSVLAAASHRMCPRLGSRVSAAQQINHSLRRQLPLRLQRALAKQLVLTLA